MKKTTKIIGLIFFTVSVLFACSSYGQTTVQVVTKTLSGEEKYVPGMKLEINGENAEIHCVANTSGVISWEVKLQAKHPEKSVAKSDLESLKWVKGKMGKKLVMRNYIELASNESKPQSNLKVIYHMSLPEGCPLAISNYFGEIQLKNLNSSIEINSEFAPIYLNNIAGSINVESHFGDISGDSLSGEITLVSSRSNIQLKNITGTIDVEALLAEIKISKLQNVTAFKIEAEKSEVSLTNNPEYRYLLDLENVEFTHPEWMHPEKDHKNDQISRVNFLEFPENPLIQIKLNIGTLELR